MRRQHHRSALSNTLTSKRVAVALCAAIAMVLGAMSVGATMHLYGPDSSGAQEGTVVASQVGPSTFSNISKNNTNKPKPAQSSKTPKESLSPVLVAPPKSSSKKHKPILVTPNIASQTSLTLGPLSVAASISNDKLELNTSLTSPITVAIPDVLQPTDPPADTPPADTPPPLPPADDGSGNTTGSNPDGNTSSTPSTDGSNTDTSSLLSTLVPPSDLPPQN